ncbi:MAG: prepilin peptidase [Candidatus Omnitrophota bacterium]
MEYFVVFICGAVLGSFLNVCVYRVPLGKSIVSPPSHCPFCERPVRWFDNVPILSYVLLLGKCRDCLRKIPLRYPAVELISGLSGVVLLLFFDRWPVFFIYWLFVLSLIALSFIDIETQELPDIITLPGILVGIVLVTALNPGAKDSRLAAFFDSLLGVLAGGGVMFLMGFFGEMIFRREALGGGDVKLMAMAGAFLGWQLVIIAFFLAPFFGAGVGIFMRIKFKSEVIPYGPYLAIASVISLLWGKDIISYLLPL